MRPLASIGCLVLVGCAMAACEGQASPTAAPSFGAGTPSPRPTATSPSADPLVAAPLSSDGLRAAIDLASIRAHLEALQRIADAHGGNRAAGTAGFRASIDYVAGRLAAAGYTVQRQEFTFPLDGAQRSGVNLIAELSGRQGSEVVMLGAHLDSVPVGPGINDNGSGSATLLELAIRLAGFEPPARTIRFAFWDAEELGQLGSSAYVDALAPDARARIAAYLNFDIIGSPNYVRFVYDEPEAAPGSDALTDHVGSYFQASGLAWEPIDLTAKADHAPFSRAGIPTGGLFSGGREEKTDAQAAAFGGTAGAPADGCSHQACDTIANVNGTVLEQMADAAAHLLVTLAGA